jgi:UDP-glucuronate 4-epimerase
MILVTGAAGFIGYHVAERLLARGECVGGVDNLNDYYDVSLKEARLHRLRRHADFRFVRAELADRAAVQGLFEGFAIDRVVHLAAQAGVRYSLTNPHAYLDSNLTGFLNVLEGCRHARVRHLVYASSSSVYGANTRLPFSVHDSVDHPVSLYAATKKANELMAHSYAHLYGLPCTGLRFFTVYGPWGRPDMAMYLFTKAIREGRPVRVFNEGRMSRDFTYVDDIVTGVVRVLDRVPQPDPSWNGLAPDPGTSSAPWRVYNIGNRQSVPLLYLIELLEKELGRKATLELCPMQAGDVRDTRADVADLTRDVDFQAETPIEVGVARYVAWFREYYALRTDTKTNHE